MILFNEPTIAVDSNDGHYDIIERSCAYGRNNKVENGPHDCSLNGDDGGGKCYCNTDNCNSQAKSKTNLYFSLVNML